MERNQASLNQAKHYLLERAKANGTLWTLEQVHEKYGQIIASDSTDYYEMAMSFLNLFDRETREHIRYSPWFRVMIGYRVNIGILHKELKILKNILDGRKEEEKKNAIKMMNSLISWWAYRLMGFGGFEIPSSKTQDEFHIKLLSVLPIHSLVEMARN